MKLLEKDNHRLKKSVSALQKCNEGEENDLSISSAEGSSHFQEAIEMLQESHLKIVLALKSSKSIGLNLRNDLLLDNQSNSDLCCNSKFVMWTEWGRPYTLSIWQATVVVWRSQSNARYPANHQHHLPQESYQDLQGHIWQQSGHTLCCPMHQCVWFAWLAFWNSPLWVARMQPKEDRWVWLCWDCKG